MQKRITKTKSDEWKIEKQVVDRKLITIIIVLFIAFCMTLALLICDIVFLDTKICTAICAIGAIIEIIGIIISFIAKRI